MQRRARRRGSRSALRPGMARRGVRAGRGAPPRKDRHSHRRCDDRNQNV